MNDFVRQLLFALVGIWSHRWLAVAVAWVVGLTGAAVVWRIPDRYEAVVKVFVDTQSVLKPLMVGLSVDPNADQKVSMLSRTLISRPNVEKLIDMSDFHTPGKTREQDIDTLMSRLTINSAGRDNLFTLTYKDANPARAKRVVQSFSDIFIESSRKQSRQDSAEAKAFIEQQIASYERKLEEAESKLKDFRLKHIGVPDAGRDLFASMEEVNTRLSEARLQLREAENSRDSTRRQLASEEATLPVPASTSSTPPVASELDSRIDALRRNLDSLLQRYTDQHPDVVGTKRVLAELEEQRRKEHNTKERPSHGVPSTGAANRVYQELKLSLAHDESNVASLRTRVAEYEARQRQLKAEAKLMPEIQAEMARLNRDYDVNKKNYETLLTRRESAQISGEMEAADGVAEFRVVEPPRVSDKPVLPNRLLLLPLVLVGAIVAGGFAGWGASVLWPTYLDSRALRESTGLPVIGSVSFRPTQEALRSSRRAVVGFVAALTSLIAVFGGGLVFLLLASTRA